MNGSTIGIAVEKNRTHSVSRERKRDRSVLGFQIGILDVVGMDGGREAIEFISLSFLHCIFTL